MKILLLLLLILTGCTSKDFLYISDRGSQVKYLECRRMIDNHIPPDRWGFPKDYTYCNKYKEKK